MSSLTYCTARISHRRDKRFYPTSRFECPRCHTQDAPFIHMFWTCPTIQTLWATIETTLQTITGLLVLHTWEACALGIFKHNKRKKVETKFALLAILLAKRSNAMHWRATEGPPVAAWWGAVKKWAAAEEDFLRQEKARGMQRQPISLEWAMLLHEFKRIHAASTEPPQDTQMEPGSSTHSPTHAPPSLEPARPPRSPSRDHAANTSR